MTKRSSKPNGDDADQPSSPASALAQAIMNAVSSIPGTTEPASASPRERARAIQTIAALKAAAVSGTLALPPGPYGIATLIPDLLAVWRIQAQMVVDIAAAYGKSASMSQEQMLYCLFRHAAAQIVRDLVTRIGGRLVFQQATLRALQAIAARLGVKVTQRVVAKSVARFLPVLGSLGVAGYAYFDTAQVGGTAIGLFEEKAE